jgi:molybdenum cofactor cytidylyltransferase
LRLLKALRISPSISTAFVGAGGKTTALFRLASEYLEQGQGFENPDTVLLSTTTPLKMVHTQWADHHIIIHSTEKLLALAGNLPAGSILFTGPPNESGQVDGLNLDIIYRIRNLASRYRFPLLIEADISRQRPVNVPAAVEPGILEWVDTVVIVAGLSALDKPINSQWAYRPERYSQISNQTEGSLITPKTIASVLQNSYVEMKKLLSNPRLICLLNQADTQELRATARHIARELLSEYNSVVIAGLNPAQEETTFAPFDDEVMSVHEPTAGILLAAGSADRMHLPKQVLPYKGVPLVKKIAKTAIHSDLSPVIVVTGAYVQPVHAALNGLPLLLVHNPDWRSGMSSSLHSGLQAALPNIGSAIFLLSDQPSVSTALLRKLVRAHSMTLDPIIAPISNGIRGNPVLFDRTTFPELLKIQGDVGGRALFNSFPIANLEWGNPNDFFDIDTPGDYQKLFESENENNPNEI